VNEERTRRHPDVELMRKIESAMARNLQDYVAAHRQVVPQAGAEYIEVGGGVAAFTGTDSPLTTVKAAGPRISPSDLDDIESFFCRHKTLNVTIELAPWLSDESERTLLDRGYRAVGEEDVVVVTTAGAPHPTAPWRVEAVPLDAWPEVMRRCFELADDSPATDLVTAAARLPNSRLFGIREDDLWIACAQSISYGDVVIFGNDGTHPDDRNRGAQTALINERLEPIPAGTTAAAEVAPGSGSERNYLRCGFQIAYTRTQYACVLH
jgi:hypothetical protein